VPAHNADLNDPKNILRILLAVVLRNGGELRVKASLMDSLDRGRLLTVDFDRKKAEIVLRATSDFGRVVVVQPESFAWTQPASEAPQERTRVQAEREAARRSIPTDEDLADMEERAGKAQTVAREVADGKSPMKLRTMPPSRAR
jgi:hypothetical protein